MAQSLHLSPVHLSIACAILAHCALGIPALAQSLQALPPVPQRDPTAVSAEGSPGAAPRLVIDVNAACNLKVDGRADDQVLMPGKPRTVDIPAGQATIECTSTTFPDVVVRQSIIARGDAPALVLVDLAAPIVKATCKSQPATLTDLGHGVLRHCVSGADWTRDDSGRGGLVYAGALEYCAKLGKGWEMPMADELLELIDRTGKSRTPCGIHTCYVSPHFGFTGPSFWSNTRTHEGMHMGVLLLQGGHHPIADNENFDYHTLCVRRPGAG